MQIKQFIKIDEVQYFVRSWHLTAHSPHNTQHSTTYNSSSSNVISKLYMQGKEVENKGEVDILRSCLLWAIFEIA